MLKRLQDERIKVHFKKEDSFQMYFEKDMLCIIYGKLFDGIRLSFN